MILQDALQPSPLHTVVAEGAGANHAIASKSFTVPRIFAVISPRGLGV